MRRGTGLSRKPLGFTLIELMIAITVAVILAALGAMSMRDFFLRSRLRSAADDLTGQIALARAEAMRMNRDTSVNILAASATSWCSGGRQYVNPGGSVEGITLAVGTIPTCDCADASDVANCVVADKVSLVTSGTYNGVDLTAGGGTQLFYNRKLGTLADLTPHTISLRSNAKPSKYGLDVMVTPMGHARVCIPSGSTFVNFGGYKSC
jgi:prepilin-type N-terminal cleavage/methylation domain-containing protein